MTNSEQMAANVCPKHEKKQYWKKFKVLSVYSSWQFEFCNKNQQNIPLKKESLWKLMPKIWSETDPAAIMHQPEPHL